jgi:hypothetical protein
MLTVFLATLDVWMPALCLTASVGSSSVYSVSWVGVWTTGVVTPHVVFLVSCLMKFRGSSQPYPESCLSVETIGVGDAMTATWRMES